VEREIFEITFRGIHMRARSLGWALGCYALLSLLSPAWARQTVWMRASEVPGLPIWMTPEEETRRDEIGLHHRETPPPPAPIRNPAEWEPMTGVLIRWPLGLTGQLIAEMAEDVMVWVIVANESERLQCESYLSGQGVNMDHVDYIIAPTNSIWTRDYGPWFIVDGNGEQGIVDHIYNRPRPWDDEIPGVIGQEWGIPVYGLPLVHAGGNYMSDGRGVSMSTRLVYDENPDLTPDQVDSLMKVYVGVQRYDVLPYIETGGIHHIDCWAKLLDPERILVKRVPPGHEDYDRIEANVERLSWTANSYGRPYEIVRLDCPDGAPYTNSLILNDKVLVPLFDRPEDADALATYQEAMPGYEVVGFLGSWVYNDAIHCRTMGITDRYMLWVDHTPLLDTDETGAGYEVAALIRAYSGQPLKADSLLLYWRVGDLGIFQAEQMVPVGADSFAATIPPQPLGSVVSYYIFAADESGRRVTHPPAAPANHHTFRIRLDADPSEIRHDPLSDQPLAAWPVAVRADARDDVDVAGVWVEWMRNGQDQGSFPLERIPWTLSYAGEFVGDVQEGDEISYRIGAEDLSGNVAYDPASGYHTFHMVESIPVVLWSPDPTPTSQDAVAQLLEEAFGIPYVVAPDLPQDLSLYDVLFVFLGIYPNNHALTLQEAQSLVAFMEAGGMVYMEGGDCWAYDDYRSIYNPYFGINGVADGQADVTHVVGEAGTFTEGMSFAYSGENNYMDHIQPTSSGFLVFHNPADGAGCGVANDAGSYRTVGLAFEFGGLVDGGPPATQASLLASILDFMGFPVSAAPEPSPAPLRLVVGPNPFGATTRLRLDLPEAGLVRLAIYDVAGRRVSTLANGVLSAGQYVWSWGGEDGGKAVAGGIYFYRLETASQSITGRLLRIP
jgi:agmatine/peptidylarginine deiminase